MKRKNIETVNQLQEIKKNYVCMDEGFRNVSSKKVAALNNAIWSVKKYRESNESFWLGFITCLIIVFIGSLIFNSIH